MMEDGVYNQFYLENHTPKSYYLMGCCGPFGILDEIDTSKVTIPILLLPPNIHPVQHDGTSCGVIWCLFIYDMMLQALVPFDIKLLDKQENTLLLGTGIGKSWIEPGMHPVIAANPGRPLGNKAREAQRLHQTTVFNVLREEMVTLLERLQCLQIENQAGNDKIQMPARWGEASGNHLVLAHTLRNSYTTQPFPMQDNPNLVQEYKDRTSSLKTIPIVPGANYPRPTNFLLDNSRLNVWFPSLKNPDKIEKLVPQSIPFGKSKYLKDILKVVNKPIVEKTPPPNVSGTIEIGLDKNVPSVPPLPSEPPTSIQQDTDQT